MDIDKSRSVYSSRLQDDYRPQYDYRPQDENPPNIVEEKEGVRGVDAGHPNDERLLFMIYDKSDLELFFRSGGADAPPPPTRSVRLYINPAQMQFTRPRVIQKIQTQTNSRFVVQDWGPDLLTLEIQGVTGRLLPTVAQMIQATGQAFPPQPARLRDSIAQMGEGEDYIPRRLRARPPTASDLMVKHENYTSIIEQTEAYQTFSALYSLYVTFDALYEVMTLRTPSMFCRGYFSNFTYTQDAESPWNWKYSASFTILTQYSDESLFAVDTEEHDERATISTPGKPSATEQYPQRVPQTFPSVDETSLKYSI